ncbi:MAG: iron donor protein CyaY [Planctomycetota bacterium]
MTTDVQFAAAADDQLRRVRDALVRVVADAVTCDLGGDLLTMRLGDGSKCTLIRQTPIRQIWLSEGVLATYFDWRPDTGEWVDPRGGGTLGAVLDELLSRRLGRAVRLDLAAR